MKNKLFTIISFCFLFLLISFPASAYYTCDQGSTSGTTQYNTLAQCKAACTATGYSCGNQGSDGSGGTVKLTNPLAGTQSNEGIPLLLGKIINSVLGVIGSLALVMFIYGGATWMLSGGNQERVTKGKQILIWATLGIIIIFSAYALVKFALTTIAPV